MKNSFGNNITVTVFGESHGPGIGAVLDGLAPGIQIDEGSIRSKLSMRRPYGSIGTARREKDEFEFLSGVYGGRTTGTPLTVFIKNKDVSSVDYDSLKNIARPGHSDYTAFCKYHGFSDPRGGGHFSGRLTAAIVAAGAILESALKAKGIMIGTHIKRLAGLEDRDFDDYEKDINKLSSLAFAVLDDEVSLRMQNAIKAAADEGDSVGGVLESAVTGVPAGVGEPFFDTVEGLLSHALFSIPGVKGVSFGGGFSLADAKGSEYNDPFAVKDGKIVTTTNNNGGVNGGITNGMPLLFSVAVKPTPSVYKEQQTVNFEKLENVSLKISGRHDPAIIHRARAVADAMTAIVIADLLTGRFGTDYLGGDR